jgi:hypothetical protein
MKTILSAICLLFVARTSFAQQQFYIKSYPANKYKHYITNSPTATGIVFFFENPADTSKPAFYIPDFKEVDIKFFKEKVNLYNAKICFNNYDSKPGDFIFSFTSDGDIIYFFDKRPKPQIN